MLTAPTARVARLPDATLRVLAGVVAAVVLFEIALTPAVGHGLDGVAGVSGGFVPVGDLVVDACIAAIALVVAYARPRNRVGWLMLAFAVLGATQNFAEAYGVRAQGLPHADLPFGSFALSIGSSLWIAALLLPATLLLNVYPDGRTGRLGRRVNQAAVAGMVVVTVALGTSPSVVQDDLPSAQPVVALPQAATVVLAAVGGLTLLACAVLSIGAAAGRTWRARAPERQQMLLLLVSVALLLALTVLDAPKWLFDVGLVAVPTAVAIGVLRYRLLGVEIVVRRTILFGFLTVIVVGVYAAGSALMSLAVPEEAAGSRIAAGALVALVLVPTRDRMQRAVDRLVYGSRRDPLGAVRQVGMSMSTASTDPLSSVAASVAAAMRSPYVVITDPNGVVLTEVGAPRAGMALVHPLLFAGERVGDLAVHPAVGEQELATADGRLIEGLAVPVAAVVRAERLNTWLARAHERTLIATSEERARIRRDLHDGLGPSLSGVSLGLEALSARVAAADVELVDRMRVEVTGAVDEVRRVIDALRPAALDQVGLVPALRERAQAITARSSSPLIIEVKAPPATPPLPAQVEEAALRIGEEAMTNVLRHARASRCLVRLVIDDALRLEVVDDGVGLPPVPRDGGVGLQSIRDRVQELDGTCTIADDPAGGVRLSVLLPLQESR